ncbi:DUF4345 family protein [Zhongshania aliphaticivorans]|uniref:DUF4345 family protein n=1 Tax=Zhongshania aliphaticivorans TaxID=1470434 RepID=UPI0039C97906
MSIDKFGRIVVAIVAAMLVLVGLAYLLFPVEVLSLTGQFTVDGDALLDVRATYGGFQLGLGLFLLVQILRRENIVFSLHLLAVIFLSVGGVRLVGSIFAVEMSYLHLGAALAEIASAAGCMILSVKIIKVAS